jgi:cyclohexa-1,5-dienecarbonyl-CoA hydratase
VTQSLITVTERYDGQVTEILLGPPPGNIVTAKVMAELREQLAKDARDPRKKLVVLGGTGKHFSFGASIEEHRPEHVRSMLPLFHQTVEALLASPVPVLAKVSGLCLGGGFELVLGCAFVYADEGAQFAVPEIQLGVFPPPAAALLPAKVGDAVASHMVLTGERWGAKDLAARGVVTAAVPAGTLDQAVSAFIETQILPKSAAALRLASAAVRRSTLTQYRAHIGALETLYLDTLMATHDAKEGLAAFQEKRPPQWLHR